MSKRIVLAIGTKKGVFIAESPKSRKKFSLRGPFGQGVSVYSALIDRRGKRPRIFASSCNAFFGMKVLRSDDLGESFCETESAPAFPEDDGRALQNIWSIESGPGEKDLLVGAEPASLFRSTDLGDSWSLVPGISNHEHREHWMPGQGGLCMHTIVQTEGRLHLGISTGGHYVSDDGGETFNASNTGVVAGFLPGGDSLEFGQCVHKIASHPEAPGRLYMQNHGGIDEYPGVGVLRSDDNGDSWYSIAEGLPSDFGFPICIHPDDPDTIYVIPLMPSTRTCPDAKPAVWRSSDGGKKWKKLRSGLPRKDSFFTVLRDAMGFDDAKNPGLYFGTTTGQLWLGHDRGDDWECLFDSLPPINCVKAALVEMD